MKKLVIFVASALLANVSFSQVEETDTTTFQFGGKKYVLISPKNSNKEEVEDSIINAEPGDDELEEIEAHWAGFEFGPTILFNSDMKQSFPTAPQWEIDPVKSFSFNLNFAEHKFPIYKNYVGITTGVGINWTQIGLKQYNLNNDKDSLWASTDSVNVWTKNKLRAIYLTVPLMLEICASPNEDGFYLNAGVVGGIRIGSSVKREIDEKKFFREDRIRNAFALNTFKLDAAAKIGYGNIGFFANYNLLSMFDTKKTAEVHPLVVGMQINF